MGNAVSYDHRASAPIFLAGRRCAEDEDPHTDHDATTHLATGDVSSYGRKGPTTSRFIPAGFDSLYHTEVVVLVERPRDAADEMDCVAQELSMLKIIPRVIARANPRVQLCRLAISRKRVLYEVVKSEKFHNGVADFRSASIVKVMPDLACYQGLTVLRLDHNDIDVLPDEIGLLKGLRELTLSHNKLRLLPHSVGLIKDLTELDISWNRLECLPPTIWGLKKLSLLNISVNEICEISRGIGTLESLKSLDAHSNRLEFLPIEINRLKQLKRLQIHGNPLISEHKLGAVESRLTQKRWTLREVALRRRLEQPSIQLDNLPVSIQIHAQKAQKCSFCCRPLIDVRFVRIRIIQRHGQHYPFSYLLCTSHWRKEKERIRTMFQDLPRTFGQEATRDRQGLPTPFWEQRIQVNTKTSTLQWTSAGSARSTAPRSPVYSPAPQPLKFLTAGGSAVASEDFGYILSGWQDIPTIIVSSTR